MSNQDLLAEQVYEKLEPHLSLLRGVKRSDPDSTCLYLSSTIIRKEPPTLDLLLKAAAEMVEICDVWRKGLPRHRAALDAILESVELVEGSMVEVDGLEPVLRTIESWLTSDSNMMTLHQAIVTSSPVHKSVILDAMDELEEGQKYADLFDFTAIDRALGTLQAHVRAHEEKRAKLAHSPETSVNTHSYTFLHCPVAPGVLMRTIYIPTNSDDDLRKMCEARGMVIQESKPPTTQEMVNYLLEKAGPNAWEC